jgi:rubrerythrin
MDFTNPFVGMARPKMSDAELAQAIRIDIAAELDAINLYQAHIDATDNPVAKRMIQHIMDEEKDHVEEFAQLLYLLDPRQLDAVSHARQEIEEETGHPAAEAPAAEDTSNDTSVMAAPQLTIGSLREAG